MALGSQGFLLKAKEVWSQVVTFQTALARWDQLLVVNFVFLLILESHEADFSRLVRNALLLVVAESPYSWKWDRKVITVLADNTGIRGFSNRLWPSLRLATLVDFLKRLWILTRDCHLAVNCLNGIFQQNLSRWGSDLRNFIIDHTLIIDRRISDLLRVGYWWRVWSCSYPGCNYCTILAKAS